MDLPVEVPVLEAGGLVLRAWEMDDLPLVREAAGDAYIPLITTVPAEYSREAGVAFVRRQWGRTISGSGYPFVIARGGRPVGAIGLWTRDAAAGRATLGYWVATSGRGQGAAASALEAVAAWGLDVLGFPRLQLYIEPWNAASVRTAERAGFRREGLLRDWQRVGGERRDMAMYSLLATDRGAGRSAGGGRDAGAGA